MPDVNESTPEPLLIFREEVYFEADSTHNGLRLDTFLARHMRWRSRTSIKGLIHEGKVSYERAGKRHQVSKASATVLEADLVFVKLPKPKRDVDFDETSGDGEDDLVVIYEDRWLLALNKPPNVAVHPSGRNLFRTVITALHKRYRRLDDPERDIVPKLCHRLDLETSGVLLVAKDDVAHRRMQQLIRDRVPKKEYLAIAHGVPHPTEGLIDLPLGPSIRRKVYTSVDVRFDGQEAKTGYRVIDTFGDFSLIRLDLLTGRHHQIRVHLSAIGHPIVGDKVYGEDEELFLRYYDGTITDEDWARLLLPRHALHAERLTFPHPITGESLCVVAAPPLDMQQFIASRRPPRTDPTPETSQP